MPSSKPQIKAVIEQENYEKLKIIAENENRSLSNLLQTLAKEKIQAYEAEHGVIETDV